MKPLVLCADDFAAHEGASQGIAALARMGRISATSAMVLSPRWPQDARLLHELRGRIDVGLHLDWTSEFARASGHGKALAATMGRALLGGFARPATRAVIERQLDAFKAQWKAPPDHVDGHQHVQQFAGIREALVEALRHRYGAAGPYVRVARVAPGEPGLKGRMITAMGADAIEKIAASARIARSAALYGIYDFAGDGRRYAALMAQWLVRAPAAGIIMCHPASAAPTHDAIGAARAQEFAYLSGEAFVGALAQAQVVLARGRALFTPVAAAAGELQP